MPRRYIGDPGTRPPARRVRDGDWDGPGASGRADIELTDRPTQASRQPEPYCVLYANRTSAAQTARGSRAWARRPVHAPSQKRPRPDTATVPLIPARLAAAGIANDCRNSAR
jgi:hypothetical protein